MLQLLTAALGTMLECSSPWRSRPLFRDFSSPDEATGPIADDCRASGFAHHKRMFVICQWELRLSTGARQSIEYAK
jgi:hypothetical protein